MNFLKASSVITLSIFPLITWAVNPWEYAYEVRNKWYFSIGAGIEYEPTYAGSDKYTSEPEIDLSATYLSNAGHRYFISVGEIGAHFQSNPDLVFSTILEFEESRDDSDDSTLSGLNEIEDTIELQTALTKRWNDYFASIALQYDIRDEGKGLVWFIAAGKHYSWSDKADSLIWLDISGADSEHMRTEFGITQAESNTTGLAPYRPGSGIKSTTLNIANNYAINDSWSIGANLAIEYYFSKASDSPLIKTEGDDLTAEAELTINYEF